MSRKKNNQKGGFRKLHKHRRLMGWTENKDEEVKRLRKELVEVEQKESES